MTSKAEIPKSTVKGRRRRRPRKHANEEENRLPNQDELVEDLTKDTISVGAEPYRSLSISIRKAEERLQMDVWKSNDALRKAVLRASLRLGSVDDDGSDFLLLLNVHESDLIRSCRTLVKEATVQKDEEEQMARLFLATHNVRALARFITKTSTQEALLQLLYHVINTLGNAKISSNQDLIFLAFEALHHLLLRHKKESGNARISFATVSGEQLFLFPVPIHKNTSEAKNDTGLAVDKLFMISIQSLLHVGKEILTWKEQSDASLLPDFLCRHEKLPATIARHLLAKVAVKWVHTMASTSKVLMDGLSHCKRIHRLLWEQATTADRDPADCLSLRQDSILVLLSEESKPLCKALESKFGDTACTYACKSSGAFVAQSKPGYDAPLLEFHKAIGARLDRVFANQFGLSYLEYCSIRAQHVGIYATFSMGQLDSRYIQMGLILKVAMLSIAANRRLEGTDDGRNELTEDSVGIIAEFRSVFLDPMLEWTWSMEDVARILKIIPVNRLHKSLYGAVKDGKSTTVDSSTLHIGACLMTQCFGLLLLRLASFQKGEECKLSEKAVDCFLRGMVIFELEMLQNKGSGDRTLETAKEVIALTSQYCLISDETFSQFERLAKFLSSTGRQREESGPTKPSMSLQIASLRLFTEISRHQASSMDDLMLSQRWSCLSSSLASNDLLHASVLAGLVSLLYEAIECCDRRDPNIDADIELFSFICSRSNGILDLSHCCGLKNIEISDRRRGTILRILRTLDKLGSSCFIPDDDVKPVALTIPLIFECFDKMAGDEGFIALDHIEKTCNVPFSLSGLLRVMLQRNIVPIKSSILADSLTRGKLNMAIDFIHELGTFLVSDVFIESDSSLTLLSCHKKITHLAINLVGHSSNEPSPGDFQALATSAIQCIAANSIAPVDVLGGKMTYQAEIKEMESQDDGLMQKMSASFYAMVKSAREYLTKCNSAYWNPLSVAMKPVLAQMHGAFTFDTGDGCNLPGSVRNAMEVFGATTAGDIASPRVLGAHIAVSFIARQAEFLYARGEGFAAIRLAEWSYRIATQLKRNDKLWFEIAYLRKLSPSTIFRNIDESTNVESESVSVDEMELQANRIRCQLAHFTNGPTADKISSLLEMKLDECNRLVPDQPRDLFVHTCWLQGTLTQILAMCCTARGDFARAISLFKDCLRLCKQALVASSRQLSSFSRFRPSHFYEYSILQRLGERQTDILLSLGSLIQGSGDHRRADSYVYSAVKVLGSEELYNTAELAQDASCMMQTLYSLHLDNSRLTELRRVIWEFAVARSSPDQYAEAVSLLPKSISNPDLKALSKDDSDLDSVLEGVSRLRLCDITGEAKSRQIFLGQARDAMERIKSTPDLSGFAELVSGKISPVPESELDLLKARNIFLKGEYEEDFRQEVALRRTCERIAKAPFMTSSQRSEALYMLGLLHLRTAREDGALTRIWHGCSNHEGTRLQFDTENSSALGDARSCFIDALTIRGPASDHLTRNILRSLALVSGPEEDMRRQMASWEMIHGSIGSSIRQRVRQAFHTDRPNNVSDKKDSASDISTVLRSLDCPFFSKDRIEQVNTLIEVLERHMPSNWKVLAVVLCPTGELLLNSIEIQRHFVSRTVCIFPLGEKSVYETMMQPFDELILQSQGQLKGGSATRTPSKEGEDHRREWWSRRERIDDEMQMLCRRVEKLFFTSDNARAMLHGDCSDDEPIYGWEAQKAHPTPFSGDSPLKDGIDPSEMKVTELRDELVDMGMLMRDLRRMRKAELVNVVREERRRSKAQTAMPIQSSRPQTPHRQQEDPKNATLLILDEDLHRFPFEALPCLYAKTICRSPSISFVAAKLLELNKEEGPSLAALTDPRDSSYILDPESNLRATRERMYEFLQSNSRKLRCEWEGIVGEAPPDDFFKRNLVRDNSMFLFFGHGSGQAYCSRSDIESLIGSGERGVKASVILMGCSSGSLVSVNRRRLNTPRKVPLLFEPEGLALSYIAAGAPCVIGNLWDVTDRDIDRLAMDLLTRFYDGQDLATSLAQARSVCKMKYLNGYAPVYYGIPVVRKNPS